MRDQARILVTIDREKLHPARAQFKTGNTAAAKPRWSNSRLQKFADELHSFRELIGFNYSEMGRAIHVSGEYVKLLERAERQPSDKLVHLFRKLKATPILTGERLSNEALDHLGKIWDHILSRRFRCPECVRAVRRGELHKGLEFWWAASHNQRFCPRHQKTARKRNAR